MTHMCQVPTDFLTSTTLNSHLGYLADLMSHVFQSFSASLPSASFLSSLSGHTFRHVTHSLGVTSNLCSVRLQPTPFSSSIVVVNKSRFFPMIYIIFLCNSLDRLVPILKFPLGFQHLSLFYAASGQGCRFLRECGIPSLFSNAVIISLVEL